MLSTCCPSVQDVSTALDRAGQGQPLTTLPHEKQRTGMICEDVRVRCTIQVPFPCRGLTIFANEHREREQNEIEERDSRELKLSSSLSSYCSC
jgi:hypothetical protein